MQIPKDAILHFLRDRGDSAKADQAERELPDQVDTDKDAGLLSKFGIDPDELLGMADKVPGLRDKLGGIL
jgi:hypothetical protein